MLQRWPHLMTRRAAGTLPCNLPPNCNDCPGRCWPSVWMLTTKSMTSTLGVARLSSAEHVSSTLGGPLSPQCTRNMRNVWISLVRFEGSQVTWCAAVRGRAGRLVCHG